MPTAITSGRLNDEASILDDGGIHEDSAGHEPDEIPGLERGGQTQESRPERSASSEDRINLNSQDTALEEGHNSEPRSEITGRRGSLYGTTRVPITSNPVETANDTSQNHTQEDPIINPGTAQEPNNRAKKRKSTKAKIKIATLNINGYRAEGQSEASGTKWNHICQIMTENEIGILLVQETHLDDERHNQISNLFTKRLHIEKSADPEYPRARAGVAIVLNKQKVNTEEQEHPKEIIPGRAMTLRVNTHRNEYLRILIIYAPNDHTKNREFWTEINDYFMENPHEIPDVMAGDFNIVEDKVDRLPMRSDPETTTDALNELKRTLSMKDGWRHTNPNKKAWTYRQQKEGGSKSRIDRIYLRYSLLKSTREWRIKSCHMSDHDMVSVELIRANTLDIGEGRRTIPRHLTKDKAFMKYAHAEGTKILEKFDEMSIQDEPWKETHNKQTLFHDYKKKLMAYAIEREKKLTPKLASELRRLEKELEETSNNDTLSEGEKIQRTNTLQRKIEALEKAQYSNRRKRVAATNRLLGETISRYWSQQNKVLKPRDLIHELKIPDWYKESTPNRESTHERQSERMAHMMGEYHDRLQEEGNLHNINEPERATCTGKALDAIDRKLTSEQAEQIAAELTEDEIKKALNTTANWKAPGLDGIPYEIWKAIEREFRETPDDHCDTSNTTEDDTEMESAKNVNGNHEHHNTKTASQTQSQKQETPKFDVIRALTEVYNEINKYGKAKETGFADGWMCPLYKKKDRDEMANYRPLTMLNTDYKILTKAMTARLGEIAPKLLHENQAGFVKGRQITDQTRLIETIIDYAEVTSTNGIIVALDQEKAYDKIAHDYLWKVLERFGFPEKYIQFIKHIYQGATTKVMVNGFLSQAYEVRRGVRQGCPLSCLIFDLAIEALAAMLRKKKELKGYKIPNCTEKLIVNLFADDTTVFLSEDDRFEDLQEELDTWCKASTARFNINKTEIIPIGTEEFRQKVILTRTTSDETNHIPENLHIAIDGEATRILGAWVGNKVNVTNIWSPILDKVDERLSIWEKTHPTIEGRKLIVQMMAGGITQYLTQAQGMPKDVEKKLTKTIRKFMWGDRTMSPVNQETLLAPITQGGRNLLDIEARNDAIEIMKLKKYLTFGSERPIWAKVADAIMAKRTPQSESLPEELRINAFLQSWKTCKGKKAPHSIRRMLKIAKKYGIRQESTTIQPEALRNMPIWNHNEAEKSIRRLAHGRYAKCLQEKHKVRTVGDMMREAEKMKTQGHEDHPQCQCTSCNETGWEMWCDRPFECYKRAKAILEKIPPKWIPDVDTLNGANIENEEDNNLPQDTLRIPSAPQTSNNISETFRVFTRGRKSNRRPRKKGNQEDPESEPNNITVYTRTYRAGKGKKVKVAIGTIVVDGESTEHRKMRPSRKNIKGNETAHLIAIHDAIQKAPPNAILTIESESPTTHHTLTRTLEDSENKGYLNTEHSRRIRAIHAEVRQRNGPTYLRLKTDINGLGREAKNLAKSALDDDSTDEPTEKVTREWRVTGARLNTITQSLAYKHIRRIKMKTYKPRHDTKKTLKRVQKEIKKHLHTEVNESEIWKTIRHKDITRTTRYFLWMVIHNAYMIGSNWDRQGFSEEYQERGICQKCKTKESMEHILFQCKAKGRKTTWKEAKGIWKRKTNTEWPEPCLGTIVGGKYANFETAKDENQEPLRRLYSILMTETAHLVWKMRCERVINNEGKEHTKAEARNRLYAAINKRLELDREMTNPRYERKALKKSVVIQTWKGLLQNEENLPTDWISASSGVLVGIERRNDDGRGRDKDPPRNAESRLTASSPTLSA